MVCGPDELGANIPHDPVLRGMGWWVAGSRICFPVSGVPALVDTWDNFCLAAPVSHLSWHKRHPSGQLPGAGLHRLYGMGTPMGTLCLSWDMVLGADQAKLLHSAVHLHTLALSKEARAWQLLITANEQAKSSLCKLLCLCS